MLQKILKIWKTHILEYMTGNLFHEILSLLFELFQKLDSKKNYTVQLNRRYKTY